MELKSLYDYQIWASAFFLTRPLTNDEVDNLPWDDFDNLITDLATEDYEYFAANQLWDRIASLADYAYTSHTTKEKTND
jgi:hypothetical protein